MSASYEFGNDVESDEETFNPQQGYGSDDEPADRSATKRAASPVKRARPGFNEAAEATAAESDPAGDEDAEGEGEDLGGGDEDEQDADDDEEDEEDDDDDDEEVARPKKRRRERRNQFIDVEAEVDDEDEDIDEDEDDQVQAEFVADTHPDDEGLGEADRDDRRHRELDRQRQAEMEMDAEEQARAYKERYGRANRATGAAASAIPQRLLLPSVEDPSIYGIRCKQGKEKEVIMALYKRWSERMNSREPLRIASAFERGSTTMAGYIYVEARTQADALQACDGLTNCYPRTNMILIAINERTDLLRVSKTKTLEPGEWVRIKRPLKYQGDLAQVVEADPSGTEVEVKIVPRMGTTAVEDTFGQDDPAAAAKRKRANAFGRGALNNRAPAKLFNEAEAKKKYGGRVVPIPGLGGEVVFNGETYVKGLLMMTVRTNAVESNVQPTLEEVSLFAGNPEDGEGVDLAALAQSMKQANVTENYLLGDPVEVFSGEQKGVVGKVLTTRGNIVEITVTQGELAGQRMEAPVKTLRKRFNEGDHVKVVGASKYQDEIGMIIRIKDDRVTLLADATQQEITVFSKDLRAANESIINTSNSKYDLHDLVQLDQATVAMVVKVDRESLRVLEQTGSIRTVLPSQITDKLERRKFAVATDRDGSEIRHDDTVREVSGEQRSGQIKQIHRQYIFCHNRHQTENAGIFVARTSNIVTIAAKGGRVQSGPDLTKMNPALMGQRPGANSAGMAPPARPQMGRDKLIGKHVKIRKGDSKGSIGRVKDTTTTHARVEMLTKNKILEFPKEILTVVDPTTGQSLGDSSRFGAGPGSGSGSRVPNGSSTSYGRVPDASRTPAYGARAPGWANPSSRTPAWSRGGSAGGFGGGRTPIAAGGMTAYGGKTAYGGATSYGGMTSYGVSPPFPGHPEPHPVSDMDALFHPIPSIRPDAHPGPTQRPSAHHAMPPANAPLPSNPSHARRTPTWTSGAATPSSESLFVPATPLPHPFRTTPATNPRQNHGNATPYGGSGAGGTSSYGHGGSTAYGGTHGGSTSYGGYGGYGAAPTPGAAGDQPTPGYGITPTASAATPGGYGAPTPGFEDDGYE